jgi:uncharacterized protein YegL
MDMVKYQHTGYKKTIGVSFPALILILLDQSSSMADSRKADIAAAAVNEVIYEIMLASRAGAQIKDRCFIGVIGYGETIAPVVGGDISQVAANPIRTELVDKLIPDGDHGHISVETEMYVWVEPKAQNGTPMAEALEKAYSLTETWIGNNPDSFPPIVINITDGEPNDFDKENSTAAKTTAAAARLMELGTTDGKLLLFNAHISGTAVTEIQLPNSDAQIDNPYAKLLFSISSVLPGRLLEEAIKGGLAPEPGARGFVFNAGADTLIKLLTFGSSVAR